MMQPPYLPGPQVLHSNAGGPHMMPRWHSKHTDRQDRRRMLQRIFNMFESSKPGQHVSREELVHLAKDFELRLYRTSLSKAEYMNVLTLKTRGSLCASRFHLTCQPVLGQKQILESH
jgi:hypothetical protein